MYGRYVNTPFRVTLLISSDNRFLALFIKQVCDNFGILYDKTERGLTTSCSNTAATLSLIFLGAKVGQQKFNRLGKHLSCTFALPLASGANWVFRSICFKGNILHKLDKIEGYDNLTPSEQQGLINQHLHPNCLAFEEKIKSIAETVLKDCAGKSDQEQINKLKMHLISLYYRFNEVTLANLKTEILENKIKTQPHLSFLYHVTISDITEQKCTFEHIFLIEQFYSPEKKETCYRLYQSWINDNTISQDIKKRYPQGLIQEQLMTESEFWIFFNRFDSYYNSESDIRKSEGYYALKEGSDTVEYANDSHMNCFDYFVGRQDPTMFFSAQEATFYGKSLQYLSSAFDPEDALKNVISFLGCSKL